ncbi:CvpA family protein [Granulicella tundricola]|uniref:Colicin V production protein n=1 Tax=Granulicella tundricola (strain ATCC BAA-1859 / DSM 23138 / MP5ACTX9) TaxID=1198114 RepID=E8X5B7_GRATM|nr:CvpA family protein [Granulicella tundricola]ADW69464.1 Colicin V production protein [Granulicella tundricola MP5ACTX9]
MQLPPTTSYNPFDWFLVVILVISTIAAFMRGLIRSLLSLVGFILAIVVASWNYLSFASYLGRWILNFTVAEIIAYLTILIVITIAFSMLANLLRKTASAVGLGFLDRLLGAAFGVLRGFLAGVAAMMAIAAFSPNSEWVKNSQLTPYFLEGAHAVSFVVPPRFEQQIAQGATHLLQQTPDLLKSHPRKNDRD